MIVLAADGTGAVVWEAVAWPGPAWCACVSSFGTSGCLLAEFSTTLLCLRPAGLGCTP